MQRRTAIKSILGAAAGGAALASAPLLAAPCGDATGIGRKGAPNLLKYAPIDPKKAARRAYEGYSDGGCCYGTFNALVEALSASDSPDAERFQAIPTSLSQYGLGGVMGLGTLCGNLNAAGMLVQALDLKDPQGNDMRQVVVQRIFNFYETERMPARDGALIDALFGNKQPQNNATSTDGEALTTERLGSSIAGSPLCHASVSRWSNENGFAAKDSAKLERCARVTAQVTMTLAQLLNDAVAGKLPAGESYKDLMPKEAKGCVACHSTQPGTAKAAKVPDAVTNMNCTSCHSDAH